MNKETRFVRVGTTKVGWIWRPIQSRDRFIEIVKSMRAPLVEYHMSESSITARNDKGIIEYFYSCDSVIECLEIKEQLIGVV